MQPWYNSRKAAQIAAYFAMREGGRIAVLKTVKLIYLAERLFMDRYDAAMLRDQLVSMDHGPVNSITLNQINGLENERADWSEFVKDRDRHDISAVKDNLRPEDLDQLSRAEIQVLDDTWGEFGHMGKYQIRDYTHDHCPEWQDPNGSSNPIPYSRVFEVLGKADPEELERRILAERQIDTLLAC
jgi:uncharacterized phage-associated protein